MLADADRELAARDPKLPGLPLLFDAEQLQQLLAPEGTSLGAVLNYLRYKPGVGCLAGVTLHSTAGVSRWTVRAWTEGSSHGTARHRPWIHNADLQLSWLRFPHDTRLRGPRWLLTDETAAHARERLGLPAVHDGDVQILTWKPERRVVLAVGNGATPDAVVRCHEPRAYARALQASHALGTEAGLPVTTPTRWSDHRQVIVTPWVEGATMTHQASPVVHFRDAGALLAALHQAPVFTLPHVDEDAADEALLNVAHDVQYLVPRLARSVDQLLQHLGSDTPTRHVVPCHGDFYVKQLLTGTHGLHLLDTDEAHLGDPTRDLANFLAHCERDACRGEITWSRAREIRSALLEGYGPSIAADEETLDRSTARAMLMLAPHPFRHRAPEWPQRIEALLDRAHELVRASAKPPALGRRPAGLSGDDALAFAQPLLNPARATAALASLLPAGTSVHAASLTRHKPGRRCLIEWQLAGGARTGESWLGKVRGKGADLQAFAMHRALWQATQRQERAVVQVAEPLGVLTMWRVAVQRSMQGVVPLVAVSDGTPADIVGALCGSALHWLHTCGVQSPRRWSVDDELGLLRERFGHLAEARPALQERLARLLHDLHRLAEPLTPCDRETLLHRDFYQDQLLIDGERVTLLDLDLVAMGDPALDVGNMVAHLTELAWRESQHAPAATALGTAFTDHLFRVHEGLTPDRVARWTCLALARLVEIASRHDNRRRHVGLLLTKLEALLSGGHETALAPHRAALLEVR